MTEQEIDKAVSAALQSGKVKSVHLRMVRAITDLLVGGMKWNDVCDKHEITRGGLSRAMKRIGLTPNRLPR